MAKTEKVNVINVSISGIYYLEGRAQVACWLGQNQALVDFMDEHGSVERFVDPKAQGKDVGAYIESLNDRRLS